MSQEPTWNNDLTRLKSILPSPREPYTSRKAINPETGDIELVGKVVAEHGRAQRRRAAGILQGIFHPCAEFAWTQHG